MSKDIEDGEWWARLEPVLEARLEGFTRRVRAHYTRPGYGPQSNIYLDGVTAARLLELLEQEGES